MMISFLGWARISAMLGSRLMSFIAFSTCLVAISKRLPRSFRLVASVGLAGVPGLALESVLMLEGSLSTESVSARGDVYDASMNRNHAARQRASRIQ